MVKPGYIINVGSLAPESVLKEESRTIMGEIAR